MYNKVILIGRLTATAIFSSKGWIALPVTILGVWTASYIIFVKPNKN